MTPQKSWESDTAPARSAEARESTTTGGANDVTETGLTRVEHGAWRGARITSSRIAKIMHGGCVSWNSLVAELLDPPPFYDALSVNAPAQLRHGVLYEPMARALFWERHPEYDRIVDGGIMEYEGPDVWLRDYVGGSPDARIVEDDKLVTGAEFKCPTSREKFEEMKEVGLPRIYKPQVHFFMWLQDVPGWWFVVTLIEDSKVEDYYELWVPRDNQYLQEMSDKIGKFLTGFLSGKEFKNKKVPAKKLSALKALAR